MLIKREGKWKREYVVRTDNEDDEGWPFKNLRPRFVRPFYPTDTRQNGARNLFFHAYNKWDSYREMVLRSILSRIVDETFSRGDLTEYTKKKKKKKFSKF